MAFGHMYGLKIERVFFFGGGGQRAVFLVFQGGLDPLDTPPSLIHVLNTTPTSKDPYIKFIIISSKKNMRHIYIDRLKLTQNIEFTLWFTPLSVNFLSLALKYWILSGSVRRRFKCVVRAGNERRYRTLAEVQGRFSRFRQSLIEDEVFSVQRILH